MPRALLREAQMRDVDVLSESEHRFEAHRDLVVSGTLTVSGTQGKAVFCTEDYALKMTENDNLMVYADPDGSVDLYYNGTKKFETTESGITVSDSVTATTYYGDGSNLTGISISLSKIEDGDSYIEVTDGSDITHVLDGTTSIVSSDSVDLYYSGNKKFETADTGIKITGRIGVNTESPSVHDLLYLKSIGSHCRIRLEAPGGYVPVVMFNYTGTDESSIQYRADGGPGLYFMVNGASYPSHRRFGIEADGGIHTYNLKSGSDMSDAGADSTELWYTSGHASLPDGVVMKGAGTDTDSGYIKKDGSDQLAGDWDYGSYTISGTGDIHANAYYGDGSNLTGITAVASGALLQDGSAQLTSDWNFGGNNITGTGNFTAAKITAEVDTGGTYDSTTVAAIFGDSDAIDNIYIIGNTINTAFNSATDTASMWLNYRGHNGSTDNYRDLLVGDGKGAVKLRLDGSAGTIRLNEAGAVIDEFSTDDTLAGDSDTALPTEKAVKTYVDNAVATISGGGGGSSTFLGLTDTPESYPSPPASGSGDSYLKTTSSGVEFQVIYYYGTGDPPAAEGLPEGTLYFKYTE